ncbi:MAG TPA: hypothetical protein GXZ79_04345 [Acholeplasma sp.]|nr:hypothetical protein [Acholeplasma sp.]
MYQKPVADLIHLKLDDTYEFHISIAYSMELFSEKEKEEAQKFFNELKDMYATNFPPILIDHPIYALYNDKSYFRECNLGRKNLGYFNID